MNQPELSPAYREALRGLQDQASVVTEALPARPPRDRLVAAQQRMAAHPVECQHIRRLVSAYETTVPELTERQLAAWLED